MYFIIYTSYAAIDFNDDLLKSLLIQSRDRNKAMSITGMLFYFDDTFIQLIEGGEDEVKLLYQDICNDTRHKRVITLKQGERSERYFTDWSMGFKSINNNELDTVEAYRNLQAPTKLSDSAFFNLLKLIAA
ncbi:BLUF domain-containing protein [Mucilaginibacter jinjuensis]|uniref:BLUF domain-containing protein n=1 Tax=Mucilaginibacter jinjuensis TaxID=1176721 RepID=A0ABY7T192_9SPHI|nr:BLUF domain-containing protein [Mucilaginibacter jinjuensis]WCT10156.1 BLUF domain-containing protein [Mucilaginibacter jinjuensis]